MKPSFINLVHYICVMLNFLSYCRLLFSIFVLFGIVQLLVGNTFLSRGIISLLSVRETSLMHFAATGKALDVELLKFAYSIVLLRQV